MKYKFDFLQEHQFTVPALVGEGNEYSYNFLGEYLDETHRKNKETFQQLDALTKTTKENLDKLQELVDFALTKNLP